MNEPLYLDLTECKIQSFREAHGKVMRFQVTRGGKEGTLTGPSVGAFVWGVLDGRSSFFGKGGGGRDWNGVFSQCQNTAVLRKTSSIWKLRVQLSDQNCIHRNTFGKRCIKKFSCMFLVFLRKWGVYPPPRFVLGQSHHWCSCPSLISCPDKRNNVKGWEDWEELFFFLRKYIDWS